MDCCFRIRLALHVGIKCIQIYTSQLFGVHAICVHADRVSKSGGLLYF